MRITTIIGTSLTLAVGILLGWSFSSVNQAHSPSPELIAQASPIHAPSHPKINPDLQQAEFLINASRPIEALAILSGISPTIDLDNAEGKDWLRLLVDAYAVMDDQNQLVLIYNEFPEALQSNERAALAVSEILLETQNAEKYSQLRKQWINREREISRWIFLDVQSKLINGDQTGAITLLEGNHFRGKDEIDRLIRLAALHVIENPERAWNYLSEAAQNDPRNPDLLTFKASLSEALNNDKSANNDYIVAVQYDPENPFRREQLADFYLRTRQYKQAMDILQDTMSAPSLDSIWLKALFWGHLAIPLKDSWKKQDIPQGNLNDLVSYILTLPKGIYWDSRAFNALPEHLTYLDTRQETFWLQLLSALKNGQEESALKLLDNNLFHYVSWAPDLEKGLKTLIRYRLKQRHEPNKARPTIFPNEGYIENPQQLLHHLANLSDISSEQIPSGIPYQLQEYLLSKDAFTMPFLAIGWTEAALQLHAMEKLPDSFPGWISEAMTKAIDQNRSHKTALLFASKQKTTPELSLLIAEIALSDGDERTAFNSLKEIYTQNDESGKRAALLLSQFLMKHNNLPDAKKAILSQPSLTHDVTAQEMLARIALEEGNLKKAYTIYLGLEKESSEAKSFLARKAFADKEWRRARELTEALLKEYPENPLLTDNLRRIIAEEKKVR